MLIHFLCLVFISPVFPFYLIAEIYGFLTCCFPKIILFLPLWCDRGIKWIRVFPLCDFAFLNKLGHCFISEQIGKLYLSWLSPLPCGPLCLLSFYITFTSHHVAGSGGSSLLTNVCCPFISECRCLHR